MGVDGREGTDKGPCGWIPSLQILGDFIRFMAMSMNGWKDCWNRNYEGAPSDGSAWLTGDCARRVMRGGSWQFAPWHLRSAARGAVATAADFRIVGMRIARPLQ